MYCMTRPLSQKHIRDRVCIKTKRIWYPILLLLSTVISNTAAPTPPIGTLSQTNNPPELRVTRVYPQTNYLGKQVSITVTDASALIALANQKSKKLVLFVNGNELSDVQPVNKDLQSNTLSFLLERTPLNKDIWKPLLRYPVLDPVRPLAISVGVQGDSPLPLDAAAQGTVFWVIGWNWWTISWLTIFAFLLLIFVLCAIYSNMLKSSEPDQDGRLPYSLSRTQAAFWLFITVISFVFIWAVTGDVSTLNGSVLGLIGISAGTYLAATITEKNQVQAPAAAVPLQVPPPAVAPPNNIQNALVKIQNIKFVGRFLADILSESGTDGVSVHKFQVFVWTLVIGIIFMVSVVNELSMPELNGTLLALMGISSATYIGAKLTQ